MKYIVNCFPGPGATVHCRQCSGWWDDKTKEKLIECKKEYKKCTIPNNVMKYGVIYRLCCCYCYDIIPKQYDNCFVLVEWWDPSSNVPQATRRSPLSTSSLRKLTNTAIAWKGSRFLEHFHQERGWSAESPVFFSIQRQPASLYSNIHQTKSNIILWLYLIFFSLTILTNYHDFRLIL